MAVEVAITNALLALDAVQKTAGGRVYHQAAPQDAALPFVRFELASRNNLKTLGGGTNFTKARYLFDCVADRSADGRALAAAIAGLEGAQTATGGGATLKWVWQEETRDNYDVPQQADERGVRHAEVELTIWYTEP